MLNLPTNNYKCKCGCEWIGKLKECPNCGGNNFKQLTEKEVRQQGIKTLINMGLSEEKAIKRYNKLIK